MPTASRRAIDDDFQPDHADQPRRHAARGRARSRRAAARGPALSFASHARRLPPPLQDVPVGSRYPGRARALAVHLDLGRSRVHRRLLAEPGQLHRRAEHRRGRPDPPGRGEPGVVRVRAGPADRRRRRSAACSTRPGTSRPVTVQDAAFTAPNADNFVDEPNNVAAIGAITIYRSLRFGKHVELVMTDLRSYRSDHAIPEESHRCGDHRAVLRAAQRAAAAAGQHARSGRTANGGIPQDPISFLGGAVTFPNLRKASPPGTMLGKAQKAWWKATMKRLRRDLEAVGQRGDADAAPDPASSAPRDLSDRVVGGDSWDGYPTERNELMTFLRTSSDQERRRAVRRHPCRVRRHRHGRLRRGDAARRWRASWSRPASARTRCSRSSRRRRAPAPASLRGLITVDASASGGSKFTENFNLLLLDGHRVGRHVRRCDRHGAPTAAALAAALAHGTPDPNTNPHLKYVDSNAQGYGYVKVTADQVAAHDRDDQPADHDADRRRARASSAPRASRSRRTIPPG